MLIKFGLENNFFLFNIKFGTKCSLSLMMNLVLNLMVVITFFFLSKFGLKGNGIWNMEMLKFISILICKEHLLVKNLVRANM